MIDSKVPHRPTATTIPTIEGHTGTGHFPGVAVSFEFFPPNDPEMESRLACTIAALAPLSPRFVSVTYGADGSARDRTLALVTRLATITPLAIAPHVTAVALSRREIAELAETYWRMGLRHLVALRGDPAEIEVRPAKASVQQEPPLRFGLDVVEAILAVAPFEISVGAYPEVHPEAASAREDLAHLKRKVEAGAARAITQFFYDDEAYLRFRDACVRAKIDVPIVPGILPIVRFSQVRRFAKRCGASVPNWLAERFSGLEEAPDASRPIAEATVCEQVERLRREGVADFHFYTLNRAELTLAACHALGIRVALGRTVQMRD